MKKDSTNFRKAGGSLPFRIMAALGFPLLVVVTFAVYYPSIHAPFIFDDTSKIEKNPDIKSLKDLPRKLIYPYHEHKWERNDPSRPVRNWRWPP